MTAAAARSAAVLRVLRRVAGGRRALRVMLFLGCLLTVGLLYGGKAHAAELPEAAPATEASASQVPADATGSVAPPARPSPARELRRVAQSVEPVREVAQPVADTVRHVVRPAVQQRTGILTGLPTGSLPEPPPVPLTPAGIGADQVRTTQPFVGVPPVVEAGGSSGATASTPGQHSSYSGGLDRPRAEVRPGHPVPAPAPARVPGEPYDSTPGVLQQSAETHTPRMGDQHAATSAGGRPFALVPGADRSALDAPTRERPRDILEFPG
ncbi:hypothetical protein [Streptomyces sp. NPDC005408]|uniref:hypothetical protein n=1 Tax=Streptomyces sp. NPDC005408 TaxID=3155341 RepID=UPI0033B8D2C4